MALRVHDLVIVSALTDCKRPTRFIPLKSQHEVGELFSIRERVSYAALIPYWKREVPYFHAYLWQVLFTLILEGGGVSPHDPSRPFVLGGDKQREYVTSAGLTFSSQEFKRQSPQLTELSRARFELLTHLSEAVSEELSLSFEAQKV